jgi:hypothetical protein
MASLVGGELVTRGGLELPSKRNTGNRFPRSPLIGSLVKKEGQNSNQGCASFPGPR